MKEFNLELAKQGHPVCTRDGRKVRIVCFDKKGKNYPILALVSLDIDSEETYSYTSEGHFYCDSNIPDSYDLIMAPSKREGWINIYENNKVNKKIFNTKDEALRYMSASPDNYITTIKIEWEE